MQKLDYEGWGRMAAIPGLQLAIDELQALLNELRGVMAERQAAEPPQPQTKRHPAKSGWDHMTPAERSAEMVRRRAVAKANKTSARRSASRKALWDKQSPAQRKQWLAALQAGRTKAREAVNGVAS
jgi:hypothetical protein